MSEEESSKAEVRRIIIAWTQDPLNEVYADIDQLVDTMARTIAGAKADAWDEGYEAADEDAPHSVKSDNPYRSQA